VLFDLPDARAIAARIQWNFEAFLDHCSGVPELASVSCALTPEDYAWIATFGVNHIARDLDEYCQRVHYRVMGRLRAGEAPVIDRALLQSLLYQRGSECFLATRDVARDLWPYYHAIGKEPPVFKVPPPPPQGGAIEPPTEEELK
jgi:hypothetical protein